LGIALGSIGEVETQLIISGKIEYLSQNELSPLLTRLDDLRKMLKSLSKSLE
jgi:four helix bundle protein